MRGFAITVIVLVVAGLTATEGRASSLQLKKGRESSCLLTRSTIDKPVSCRGVLSRLDLPARARENNGDGSTLPYDEFGLGANQPNQPRVGDLGAQTGRGAAGLAAAISATEDDGNNVGGSALPYDEFGLGANQPNQPQVGDGGP